MPTISVVIPALDDADFLRTCLAALRNQSRPADEIIVVDNGSTDDTAAVARTAGVRLLYEALPGIFPATATGFDAATGDIIARLDTDSVPPRDWLERIEASLAALRSPAAVTGSAEFYGGNRVACWFGQHVYLGGYFLGMTVLLGHPPLFGSNFAMHRELWALTRDRAHRELKLVHDDLDFSMNLPAGSTVHFDRRLLVAVSARPFGNVAALAKRVKLAYYTLAINAKERSYRARRAEFRLGLQARDSASKYTSR
ncbi:glycosyl transferase family 2 [Glaciihabitans tibetensis]|uniref:Glycosyl transferase family 2 n=1 Tax=Glaciihabitans tibetensis TaxID=1266600 RepID=A0A2T0VK36_9MICO|nr:glycosyltransferase family A protein [Glaciihabitans tibetensis]PRY70485.1 glycosyl transferase family 2 [Glaciihabitans tibetensis]